MIDMEYRAWIDLPHLPVSDEERWQSLMRRLERDHGDLGPVGQWDEPDTMRVILGTDAPTPVEAAREMIDAVMDSLEAAGMTDTVPSGIHVEPAVDDLVPAR